MSYAPHADVAASADAPCSHRWRIGRLFLLLAMMFIPGTSAFALTPEGFPKICLGSESYIYDVRSLNSDDFYHHELKIPNMVLIRVDRDAGDFYYATGGTAGDDYTSTSRSSSVESVAKPDGSVVSQRIDTYSKGIDRFYLRVRFEDETHCEVYIRYTIEYYRTTTEGDNPPVITSSGTSIVEGYDPNPCQINRVGNKVTLDFSVNYSDTNLERTVTLTDDFKVEGTLSDPEPTPAPTAIPSTDLSVSIINPSGSPKTWFDQMTYSVQVRNVGSAAATSVVLNDTLPSNSRFVSATTTKGSEPTEVANLVTCNIGTLAPLESASVTIKIIPTATFLATQDVPDPPTVNRTNKAQVSCSETEPNLTNNKDVDVTQCQVYELSGKRWVNRFPTSTSLDDLSTGFGAKVTAFFNAIGAAKDLSGAAMNLTPRISATRRPRERAYMMNVAHRIANGLLDPRSAPTIFAVASKFPVLSPDPGPLKLVAICWVHYDTNGAYSPGLSIQAAKDMCRGFTVSLTGVTPALSSNHIKGDAIDMNFTWDRTFKILKNGETLPTIIDAAPRNSGSEASSSLYNGNAKLNAVGRSYGVIKWVTTNHITPKNPEGLHDGPHWSIDGN